MKQTWKLINDLTKRSKQQSVKETEFKVDNTLINDKKEIEVHADATFKSYLQGDYVESMMLSPTYKKEVDEVIKNMDPRKSCRRHSISSQVDLLCFDIPISIVW